VHPLAVCRTGARLGGYAADGGGSHGIVWADEIEGMPLFTVITLSMNRGTGGGGGTTISSGSSG